MRFKKRFFRGEVSPKKTKPKVEKIKRLGRGLEKRPGPYRGISRSRVKERRGALGVAQLSQFFERRAERRGIPLAKLKGISIKHKASWIADCFKGSSAACFQGDVVKTIILPIALKQPVKFAEGLGQLGGWFFKGLGANAELFFHTLGAKGCLKKFIKRLYYKNTLSLCDSQALGRGIAKYLPDFFEAMGKEGLHRFAYQLKENQQTYSFFSGLQEALGENHPSYLLAKQKII